MLKRLYKKSRFAVLFNFSDEKAFGRTVMMTSSTVINVISLLTGGLFYTTFLMMNGINLVNIGIITFIPYIANCFSVFSPSILERFPRRRWVLAGGRLAYHSLNLLAITLMPVLVQDPSSRVVWFAILTFMANMVGALFGSGYTAWHLNFIPDSIRAEYFSTEAMIAHFISGGTALASGLIADALASSPYQNTIVVLFRYIAFALAVFEVWALTRPAEYPYPKTADKPRLRDIVIKPFSKPKFMLTMMIVFLWVFFANIPAGALNYHLINNVGVQYTFIYVINLCYPVFLLLFTPLWKKWLRKWGWLKTFALGAVLCCPTTLMYSCITAKNYLWLYTLMYLFRHFLSVGVNTTYANLTFINMPSTDQTNYIAFHTLAINAAGFLGMMAGTMFIGAFPQILLSLGGMEFNNVQILLWVKAFGELMVPLLLLLLLPRMQPDQM